MSILGKKPRFRTVLLVLVFVLVLAMSVASLGAADVDARPDVAGSTKIHSALLDEMKDASATEKIEFTARIKEGTDLSAYTDQWFARPYVDPLGSVAAAGFATRSGIMKMAGESGVIYLRPATSVYEMPEIEDEELKGKTDITPQINTDPDASPGPAPEGWYSTTGAIHGSQDAWAKGYTGEGVRYMSNDTGADYCHPDLHGTWAYIDDVGSPYYGLPQMFDSFSSYMTAYDYYLGTSRIADGVADYTDTSATAAGDFSYQPIGADVAHDYTVPFTSISGVYHYGSHVDNGLAYYADYLSFILGGGLVVEGERAAVLVVDEYAAGVYDTVYVDLNYNFDFTDDTPARLTRDFTDQEAACLDYDLDGLNDVSGGLVYYISDGLTGVPTHDWWWGISPTFYGNGDLVAFHVLDWLDSGTHGMGTTSVAVGQGVVIGSLTWGPAGSPIADYQGLVVGPGKDVMSTQNGDQYSSPFIEDATYYATLGYDGIPYTGDEVQIISNSFGYSGTDNDGWDYDSRNIDAINRGLGVYTTQMFSTGNGAAGYGTTAPPSPSSAISVGASTLFGSIGSFEAIASSDQILGGDVISWSNRGPGARNITGVDVVATGAFGTGDLALNTILWGAVATDSFGGTSMSSPVAAGNLALIYQAWYERTGQWPTFDEAKLLLMGSAKNTGHDIWSQGGGLVDADEGTDVAAGLGGVYASPSNWSVGDYRGDEFPGFTNIIDPGERDTQTFTLHNNSDKKIRVNLGSEMMKLINTRDYSFTSLDQSLDHGDFTTPDYAFQIDKDIPNATDLMMVRVTKPYDQFDPTGNFGPYSNWRVHLQNWTDLNGDGDYWIDANGNGKVDLGEMQTGEHIRYSYGYNTGPTQQVRIANPLKRMDDGILLTFRHRNRTPLVPTTDLTIEASFYHFSNWDWMQIDKKKVTVPANGTATFKATVKVPPQTPYGMYEGALIGRDGDSEVVIPVTIAVAASGTSFTFGDTNYKNGQTPLYDNERVFGYTDYAWRPESGDWRFFWTDVADEDLPDDGSNFFVVDNAWQSPGTDIDSIVMGPYVDGFSPSSFYGPYTMEPVGGSVNTYIGSGRWLFQTSTGGPREVIAVPVQEGLHGLFLHQVRVDGSVLSEPFAGTTGLVNLNPAVIAASGSGSAEITISSEIELGGFVAEGFGLVGPVTTIEDIYQDNPNDPSTASFVTTVVVDHGALLEVDTCCTIGSDIDLFVYDPDGYLVASSTTSTDIEHVSILFPEDGTYTIAVHGWNVPMGSDTFELTINAVQGYDVTATNLPASIPAGGSDTVTVEWDASGLAAGTYYGLVLMGPAEAPALFQVPLEITVP